MHIYAKYRNQYNLDMHKISKICNKSMQQTMSQMGIEKLNTKDHVFREYFTICNNQKSTAIDHIFREKH